MAGHVLALLFAAAAAARAPAWQQRSRVARAPARSPVSAFRMMVVMPDAAIDVQRPPKSAEATVVLTIPGEATREVFDGLVRRAKETAVVNGFKKGTAPEALVVGAVGKKRLASDAIAALLEHYCGTAVGRAVPDAIGEPKVAEDSEAIMEAFSPGKPLTLTLSVELWPQVSVSKGDYDKLHIEVRLRPTVMPAPCDTPAHAVRASTCTLARVHRTCRRCRCRARIRRWKCPLSTSAPSTRRSPRCSSARRASSRCRPSTWRLRATRSSST